MSDKHRCRVSLEWSSPGSQFAFTDFIMPVAPVFAPNIMIKGYGHIRAMRDDPPIDWEWDTELECWTTCQASQFGDFFPDDEPNWHAADEMDRSPWGSFAECAETPKDAPLDDALKDAHRSGSPLRVKVLKAVDVALDIPCYNAKVSDLARMSEREWRCFKNVGPSTLYHMKEILKAHGMEMRLG